MEEEEEGENLSPFWLQSTTNLRHVDRYRHRLSSLFFNVGILLILLLVTAVFFMVFIVPTTVSFSAQIFRPNTVKKSWDSVNLVLVLFALFFGFLGRNRNDDDSCFDHQTSSKSGQKSNPSTPNKWYDFPDWTIFNNPTRSMGGQIRRNSTSYPDLHLREVSSPWVTGDDQWRFYDDTQVNSYRIVDSDHRVYYRRRSRKEADKQAIENKNVDTFVSKVSEVESPYVSRPRYSPPPSSAAPPPPPPPPPSLPQWRAAKEKEKRIYQTIAHEEKTSQTMRYDLELTESLTPPLAAPPPPMQHWEQKSSRSDHKKRDGGNATKDNFLTSFYHKKKKKRQRQRSVDNLDAFFNNSQPPPTHSQPPPPSVFHNLFSSRKGKRRRIPPDAHPAHPAPPPPPPPPPPFTTVRVLKSRTQTQPATTYRPPLSVKISSFKSVDENSSSGGSSPLVPAPPPPPFKTPDWKFVVQGEYVSIQSSPSSPSGSPDLDDVETSTPGGDATSSSSSLFCPSPDVDAKADNFIARFRAELKLQKINSFNKKQGPRMSNLGPRLGPTQI